jgi:TonB family protein
MNTATIRADWVGRVIDERFTLLQWLGGSERGGVFLTELEGPGSQKDAIKLIPADAGAEARIAGWALTATLSHPHLMRLLHTGRCQIDTVPLLYSVTEYADEVLSQILPERPLTPSEAREMLDAVLDALSYLHGKGFVHGHLKPSNIMAVGDLLKLSSDSLHRAGEPGRQSPEPSVYDAPEVANGTISTAADSWLLGVTLVEVLTQRPPVWERSADGEPVVPESIPQPFADIARECLRSDPARRCTLGDVKARLAPSPALPVPSGKPGGTAPAKLRVPALVAAALVLFAIVAAVVFRSHQPRSSPPTGEQQPVSAIAAPQPQSPVPEAQSPAPEAQSPAPEAQSPVAETQKPSAPEIQKPPVPGTQSSKGAALNGAVDQRVLPDVPRKASETIHGTVKVRIRVTVDPNGSVSSATLDSPGASKYFSKLAFEAAQHWKFKPAQVDGQAVSSAWILEFQFRQSGTEVIPTQASP